MASINNHNNHLLRSLRLVRLSAEEKENNLMPKTSKSLPEALLNPFPENSTKHFVSSLAEIVVGGDSIIFTLAS